MKRPDDGRQFMSTETAIDALCGLIQKVIRRCKETGIEYTIAIYTEMTGISHNESIDIMSGRSALSYDRYIKICEDNKFFL
jgi:hypothetical protein